MKKILPLSLLLAVCLCTPLAHGAVAFGADAGECESLTDDPLTCSSIVAAGATNEVLVVACGLRAITGTPSVDTVTFNGDAMTEIIEAQNATSRLAVALYWLPAPDTGTFALVANFTTAAGAEWTACSALTLTGADQSAIDSSGSNVPAAGTSITVPITIVNADSFSVGAMSTNSFPIDFTSNTAVAAINTGVSNDDSFHMQYEGPLSAGADSLGWSGPSTGQNWAGVIAGFKTAGAGAGGVKVNPAGSLNQGGAAANPFSPR